MTRTTTFALFVGSALLLSSGATAEAARGGFMTAPHFSAPHFTPQRAAPVTPFRASRPIGSQHFASRQDFDFRRPDHRFGRQDFDFRRPDHRFDGRFLGTHERFENRFGAPFWGFWPDVWPDEVVAPATPEVPAYGQPTDTGSGSDDAQQVPVAGSDMGSTVVRHDFPGYTVFDYCRVPPRDLRDCGPEWIVMHPVPTASATLPAPGAGK